MGHLQCSIVICTLLALAASTYATQAVEPSILEFRETNYTSLQQNVTYKSSRANDPKGMEPLYKITNLVLDFFLDEDPIAEGKSNCCEIIHRPEIGRIHNRLLFNLTASASREIFIVSFRLLLIKIVLYRIESIEMQI